MLEEIQARHAGSGYAFRDSHTKVIESKEEFYAFFLRETPTSPKFTAGLHAYWNGSAQLEAQIKDELKVTIRCIPFENKPVAGRCIFTGEPSAQRAVWAKSCANTRTMSFILVINCGEAHRSNFPSSIRRMERRRFKVSPSA